MVSNPAGLAEELEAIVGASLRTVGTYAGTDYAVHSIRDDVAPTVDPELVERIHEELILEAMGGGYQEQLFGLGDRRASVQYFDEGLVIQVHGEAYTGVFVSMDPAGAGQVPAVVDAARAYLRNQSSDDKPMVRGAQ